MSTKTTFKRIALVAVASLGLGVLTSVAPATADADLTTLTSATSTTTVGVAVTNVLTVTHLAAGAGDTITATAVLLSAPITATNTLTMTDTSTVTTVNNSAGSGVSSLVLSVGAAAAGRSTRAATLGITPNAAGTYVVRVTPGGTALNTTALTWTITVTDALAVSAAFSTSFINAGETTTATADATVVASRTISNDTQTATIVVTPMVALATAPVAAVALSATITGPGVLGINTAGNVASIVPTGRAITGTAGQYAIGVFSDGSSGVATVTISAGTVVLATETVTFFGPTTSFAQTSSKTNIGVSETGTVTVTAKDASGVASAVGTIFAVSADTTKATVAVSGSVVTVTGVAAGATTVTICDTALCAAPTVSLVVPVTISKVTAASIALSFDKAEYSLGERMTVTVTALDSNGLGVADGSRNLFSAAGITSNVALQGATYTAAAAVTVVAGKATFTAFAPLVPGPVVISATQGAALDNVIALATSAVAVTAATTVVGDGAAQAAADAAAEATDAANAATDAANAAAEAADAATAAAQDAADAVAALSTQVAELVSALRKQITSLTNLVIKIQKKVRA
jgi:trimeric autotransporter adhesin